VGMIISQKTQVIKMKAKNMKRIQNHHKQCNGCQQILKALASSKINQTISQSKRTTEKDSTSLLNHTNL